MNSPLQCDADGLLQLKTGDIISNQGVKIGSYFYPFDDICHKYQFHITGGLWERLRGLSVSHLRVRVNTSSPQLQPSGFIKTAVKIWGIKFDLTRVIKAKAPEEVEHIEPKDGRRLQCAWYPPDEQGRYTIEIDVLPKPTASSLQYTRFLHSLINPNNLLITHIDGAIKEYTAQRYNERFNTTLRKSEKAPKYTKIFRYDGDMTSELWFPLVESFFFPEPLLKELFSRI